jgi:hypothetical protein
LTEERKEVAVRVFGRVVDAKKEMPISGAKIILSVGEKELATLFSDNAGNFEHREAASYAGETLVCQVEKEKYHSQKVTHTIKEDEVRLEVELVPETKGIKLWHIIFTAIAAILVIVAVILITKPRHPNIKVTNLTVSSRMLGREVRVTSDIQLDGELPRDVSTFNFSVFIKRPPSDTFLRLRDRELSAEAMSILKKKKSVSRQCSLPTDTNWGPGHYDIGFIADRRNDIKESNDNDNIQIKTQFLGRIGIIPPPSVIMQPGTLELMETRKMFEHPPLIMYPAPTDT